MVLSADCLCFHRGRVLLIERGKPPYVGQMAFPGGMVEDDENARAAARRELEEETGLVIDPAALVEIGAYTEPDRDPRGRTVSVAFALVVEDDAPIDVEGRDDAARAEWVAIDHATGLAFDHDTILSDALARLGLTNAAAFAG